MDQLRGQLNLVGAAFRPPALFGAWFCVGAAFSPPALFGAWFCVGAAFRPPALALAAILVAGCGRSDAQPADAPRVVVDSLFPIEEEIRRFAEPLGKLPEALGGGEPSADALVRRWARAVAAADTADLVRMLLTPAEFIALYYPESRYTMPPYRQSPRLFWFLHGNRSSRGFGRVLQRHGGRPLGLLGYRCAVEQEAAGRTRVWGDCAIRRADGADTTELRLFGGIIERDGAYKFYSYASGY